MRKALQRTEFLTIPSKESLTRPQNKF